MLQTRDTKASSSLFHFLYGESGTAMLFVLVLAVICSLLVGAVSLSSRFTMKRSGMRREKVAALNIAEAGKENFYARLLHEGFTLSPDADELIYNDVVFGGGTYTVRCVTGADPNMMTIFTDGKEGNNTIRLEILASKTQNIPVDGLAARMSGAIITKSDVDLSGNFIADGRDHDSLGVELPGMATDRFGVYSAKTVTNGGSSTIGGNGQAPIKDIELYEDIVFKDSVPVDSIYIYPETVFGLPIGSLDSFAKPASAYTYPFTGFVYATTDVEKPGTCKGILIVHNSTWSATVKFTGGDHFTGLVICDRIDKLKGNSWVRGAVVVLDSSSSGKACGGTGDILYSRQVLENLDWYCKDVIKYKVNELSWRELP